MEEDKIQEPVQDNTGTAMDPPTPMPLTANPVEPTVSSQVGPAACTTCGTPQNLRENATPNFVYVLGRIIPKFPNESVEKEYHQVMAREVADKTKSSSKKNNISEDESRRTLLGEPRNRYLIRQICWVMTVQGLETYILLPRDPADSSLLCECLRDMPLPTDIDVVIGMRGPMAPPEACNGLMLPVVWFDQLYSFDLHTLIKAIPRSERGDEKDFTAGATGLFQKIQQMSDNAGGTDEYRALNYLTVRDPLIYHDLWQKQVEGKVLTDVRVRPSRLTNIRRVMDVILHYMHKQTGVIEKSMVRVDVTEEFPFITSKLSPYYVYDQFP